MNVWCVILLAKVSRRSFCFDQGEKNYLNAVGEFNQQQCFGSRNICIERRRKKVKWTRLTGG